MTFFYRLFFYNTNIFYVDGDEAIIGLMGIDMLSGDLPLYFYGQKYGFSLFEVILVALGITSFGTTAMAIKLPMALLWTASALLFTLTAYQISRRSFVTATLVMLVLITLPSWLIWSMKARGGYLTSLLGSNLIMYLLICSSNKTKFWFWPLIGILLALIYESQALWLPVTLLGCALYFILIKKKTKVLLGPALQIVVTAFIVWALLYAYKQDLFIVWKSPPISFNHLIDNPLVLFESLNSQLNGLYYLHISYDQRLRFHTIIISIICVTILVSALQLIIKKRSLEVSLILLLPASLIGVVINPNPRYLLPFSFVMLMVFLVFVFKSDSRYQVYSSILLLLLLIANLSYAPYFRLFSQMKIDRLYQLEESIAITDNQIVNNLIYELKQKDIRYVIARNDFLEYKINYFTGYEILALGKISRTRQPENVSKVEKAFKTLPPDQFALVGYNWGETLSEHFPVVNRKLYYWVAPDSASLAKIDLLPIRN